VFCSFNNNYKITPEVFDVWMKLLRSTPGSVLWLLEGNKLAPSNLRTEVHKRGVAPERLVFAPRRPLPDHLARHQLVDLFLDTFPVNAHTTASDALWAGCPVLTLSGETFISRVAGSLLRTIGLPELITTHLDDYRTRAFELTRHPEELASLRKRLQENRLTSPVFDIRRTTKAIESAYESMQEIHLSGEPTRPIAVSPG
jgi:predicted O-linked N-acetylglucosamine transferase (SPINDLY family)